MGKQNNLLDYTMKILQENNLHISDIVGILFKGYNVPVDKFIEIANKTWYDSGYGVNEIDTEFYILLNDYILVWDEYDGSEGWRVIDLHFKKGDVDSFRFNCDYN